MARLLKLDKAQKTQNPTATETVKTTKKDNKKAEKYYKKALKIEPEDYAAISNLKIIQSSKSKKGQSSK